MPPGLKSLYHKLGRIEKTFIILVLLAVVLAYAMPSSGISLLVGFAAWILGFIVAIRLARSGVKKLIWRLRNRLIVAYAFIALVPIVLILVLVLVSAYGLTGQIALYLINSELDRRTGILRGSANAIADAPAAERWEAVQHSYDFAQRFFPSAEILVLGGAQFRDPAGAAITAPPAGWKDANGIIVKDRQLFSWANVISGGIQVVIMAPLSQEFLSHLLPGVGQVSFRDFAEAAGEFETNAARTAPAEPGEHPPRIPPKNV